jgi:hypothetical protein
MCRFAQALLAVAVIRYSLLKSVGSVVSNRAFESLLF